MKILFLKWDSFCNVDIMDAYKKMNYTVVEYPYYPDTPRQNTEVENALHACLNDGTFDYVFSFNYFPLVSTICSKLDLPYISWIYDSPYVSLYSYTTINPCNRIFVFDKTFYQEFHDQHIPTVHYLPMAANTERMDSMKDDSALDKYSLRPAGEVAFVGSLYTESHLFYDQMSPKLKEYTKGYLDAVLAAQQRVYGCNFLEEVLPPDILADMQQALPLSPHSGGVESSEYLFANYVLCRKLTILERIEYLYRISLEHPVDLYSPTTSFTMPNILNHGTADCYTLAPYIYRLSAINLNISLRSIKSGIPLRAFDIMGAGGFLLSNYQADFLDYFTPGEDFAYFDSPENLTEQVNYYLKHPEERMEIAANGHKKIQEAHTFLHRVKEMESYL